MTLSIRYMDSRGTTLGLVYIVVLFVPTWILVAGADYVLGNPLSFLLYPFQSLLSLFLDVLAHLFAVFFVLFGGLLPTKRESPTISSLAVQLESDQAV
jgi:hypothetical protein